MKVELVEWLDSGLSLHEGWATKEVYLAKAGLDRMAALSAGFVMHEDDDQLILALSYDAEHDTYFSAQVIAKSAIVRRETMGGLSVVRQAA